MTSAPFADPHDLVAGLRSIDVEGASVCLHSSLRSFGALHVKADSVVRALLSLGCTVLVPTFTPWFKVQPSPEQRVARNGWDYDYHDPKWIRDRAYDPEDSECAPEMGAVSQAVAAWPGRARGVNPLCSFSAVGPRANELASLQTVRDPYPPLERLCEIEGRVLLMGVGLDRMTLIHLAEQRAGRAPFRRWAINPTGEPLEVWAGTCSTGFPNLDRVLAPIEARTMVGRSLWRSFPAQEALERTAQAIRSDPGITHCPDPACRRCNDAVAGGPIVEDPRDSLTRT